MRDFRNVAVINLFAVSLRRKGRKFPNLISSDDPSAEMMVIEASNANNVTANGERPSAAIIDPAIVATCQYPGSLISLLLKNRVVTAVPV